MLSQINNINFLQAYTTNCWLEIKVETFLALFQKDLFNPNKTKVSKLLLNFWKVNLEKMNLQYLLVSKN